MIEEWRDIPEAQNFYQASNLGNIRHVYGNQLKPKFKSNGYAFVCLYINKPKPVYRHVHRLVAAAFLGDNSELQVNHKDQNKTNNRLDNLEWVTKQDNIRHSIRLKNHNTTKLAVSDVLEIREYLAMGFSPSYLAAKYEVHPSGIYNIKRKSTWSYV